MHRFLLLLAFLGSLLLPAFASAQTGAGLELSQDRIDRFFQSCLEGTGGDPQSDSSQARKCTKDYYAQCAESEGYTADAQHQCWGALESYWDAVGKKRAKRIENIAPADLKRYVVESGRAEERYRKERCRFYDYLKAPWTGPAHAKCLTDTLIDRAVDLQIIEENLPR